MEDKKCKNCRWFPCTKFECNIGSKNGCLDFESTVQKELKESLIILEKTTRYKRQPCINCEYKVICAGECEKTI